MNKKPEVRFLVQWPLKLFYLIISNFKSLKKRELLKKEIEFDKGVGRG